MDKEDELIKKITRATRSADTIYGTTGVGGSARHWVRDCFLPELEKEGLRIVQDDESAVDANGIEQVGADMIRDADSAAPSDMLHAIIAEGAVGKAVDALRTHIKSGTKEAYQCPADAAWVVEFTHDMENVYLNAWMKLDAVDIIATSTTPSTFEIAEEDGIPYGSTPSDVDEFEPLHPSLVDSADDSAAPSVGDGADGAYPRRLTNIEAAIVEVRELAEKLNAYREVDEPAIKSRLNKLQEQIDSLWERTDIYVDLHE